MTQHDLSSFLLVFVRLLGVFAVLPLGWDIVSIIQRFSLAFALALYFCPLAHAPDHFGGSLLILELIIGMVLALPVALVVEGAGFIGEFIDAGRGQTIAQAYEPLQNNTISLTSIIAKTSAWCMVLHGGFVAAILKSFILSLEVVPSNFLDLKVLQAIAINVLKYIPLLLYNTSLWCLPFAVIYLTVDLALGFLSKAINGASLASEAFLLKSVLAALFTIFLVQNNWWIALLQIASPQIDLVAVR